MRFIPWLSCTLLLFASLAQAVSQPITNVGDYQHIDPTYGGGEMVEPDVIYVPGTWHGFEYWMSITPVPCGDESWENPSIYASHDGQTWVRPDSITEPIYPKPADYSYHYNNDPCIVLGPDSLYVYFNKTERNAAGYTDILRTASANGSTWTTPSSVPTVVHRQNYPLSPSVIRDGSRYLMWYVQLSACGDANTQIMRRTSTDGLNWSSEQVCTLWSQGYLPWHLNVRRDGAKLVMLYDGWATSLGCGDNKHLYYAESADSGVTWTMPVSAAILNPATPASNWDGQTIYRAGFISTAGFLRIWYSANTHATCYPDNDSWHTGYTQGCYNGGDCVPPATSYLGGSGGCYDHVFLQWTAPGDDGTTGTAAEYDLRWATTPITEATFGSATPIFINPPQSAGSPEMVNVGVPRCSATRWYAFRTRDAANNWSPVSNSTGLRPGCPTHGFCDDGFRATPEGDPGAIAFDLAAPSPNPIAGSSVQLAYGIPASAQGTPLELAVYDLAGRRIAAPARGTAVAGRHSASWNLTDNDGRPVRNGLYFIRLRAGANVIQRQVIVAR